MPVVKSSAVGRRKLEARREAHGELGPRGPGPQELGGPPNGPMPDTNVVRSSKRVGGVTYLRHRPGRIFGGVPRRASSPINWFTPSPPP